MRTSSSAVPPTVALVKNKLHGGRGVWKAYEVRNDADGRWLYTPAGSLYRGADGHHLVDCEVEGGDGPGLDSLILVPAESQHWLACWRVPKRELHINVEVCGWDRRTDELISFIDWELDPFRMRSGLVAVEDVDDFVEARGSGLLSSAHAEQALHAAALVERGLRQRSPPFDDRGDILLAEAAQIGLPPLTQVQRPASRSR